MKTITAILLLCCYASFAQSGDTWHACYEGEDNLRGFKDNAGNVKIDPKFTGFTAAWRFDHIMAATEDINGKWETYYLLKDGTKFGKDSVYSHDFSFDCEREGFIKFYDRKADKVGMFNRDGKVAIPAIYNAMTGFRNGMAIALKGAEKVHMKHNHGDCDHWYWGGGTYSLINAKNETLIQNFDRNLNLDYHSLVISPEAGTDEVRVNYKGVDGKYYSFVDYEKLFMQFWRSRFTGNLTIEGLIADSYHEIIYWDDDSGWVVKDRKELINSNFALLSRKLKAMPVESKDYSISVRDHIICPEGMGSRFDRYRDNCGTLDTSRYPLMEVYIQPDGDYDNQYSFSFLKTEDGFKLLSVSLRDTELK